MMVFAEIREKAMGNETQIGDGSSLLRGTKTA